MNFEVFSRHVLLSSRCLVYMNSVYVWEIIGFVTTEYTFNIKILNLNVDFGHHESSYLILVYPIKGELRPNLDKKVAVNFDKGKGHIIHSGINTESNVGLAGHNLPSLVLAIYKRAPNACVCVFLTDGSRGHRHLQAAEEEAGGGRVRPRPHRRPPVRPGRGGPELQPSDAPGVRPPVLRGRQAVAVGGGTQHSIYRPLREGVPPETLSSGVGLLLTQCNSIEPIRPVVS